MSDLNWAESYAKLEEAYIGTLDEAQKAEYFKNRTIKAEEEVAKLVVENAKKELAAKYPAADLEEVSGKTVSELEDAFKRSQERNQKAFEKAEAKVKADFEEKIKGLDEAVQAELGDIMKAWGKTRVPPEEATGEGSAANAEAVAAMQAQGINVGGQDDTPTTFDGLLAKKMPQALSGLLRIPVKSA